MRVAEKGARENGYWEEKKREWTQAHIRYMIGAIINKFMKTFIDRTSLLLVTVCSTDRAR